MHATQPSTYPALRHGGRWAPVDRGEDIYCYSYSYSPNRHLVQCVQHCRLGLGMPCSSSHLSLYSYLPYSPVRQHRVDGDDARARAQAGREHVCEVHVVEARREGEEHLQPRAPEAATACTGGCNPYWFEKAVSTSTARSASSAVSGETSSSRNLEGRGLEGRGGSGLGSAFGGASERLQSGTAGPKRP